MKTLDEMTPEELRSLADEKEKDWANAAPTKKATLKHNLYQVNRGVRLSAGEVFTEDEKNKLVESLFSLNLPAGTEFEFYEHHGWFDCDTGLMAEMDEHWGDEHLENIEDVK